MKRVSTWILKHRAFVLTFFALATVACVYLSTLVRVNYRLSDYLPDDAPSTLGLRAMEDEFASEPSNLRVLIEGASIPEALSYKRQIAAVPGVKDVTWLDDEVDVHQPLQTLDADAVDSWYKDGNALITAYVEDGASSEALKQIRQIIGEENRMAGDIVQTDETRTRAVQDIAKMMVLAVPIIFFILLFATSSYFEPVLFLLTIGVAILLGKGTDLIFGQISFITSACSAILQLAISMDYAIFLLESFEGFRQKGLSVPEAMSEAMCRAFKSILSSCVTTVIGFLVLVLMEFKIGYDMGLTLAKGIALSLVSVLVLLPVLSVTFMKVIDRTHHRPFLPKFQKFGRFNARMCIPVALVMIALVVFPCYLASEQNDYAYGTTQMITDPSLRVVQDQKVIDEMYGKANQMVVMVAQGQPAREQLLYDELRDLPGVTSVVAYASMADTAIPVDFVGRENLSALIGEHYSRMIVTSDTPVESEESFRLVEDIRQLGEKYYPGESFLTGGTSNIYDMRDTVIRDDRVVNFLAIAAIGIVLLFNFRSLLLPLILVATIKSSIWINLAVPYFAGETLYYISLLIINAIQLGATVDYAILFTDRYMEKRKQMGRLDAVAAAISGTTASILTSAGILFTGGTVLGGMSSVAIIGQIGYLVGRGAAISAFMVLMVLPALLILFDPLIRVTTIRAQFYKKKKQRKRSNDEKAQPACDLRAAAGDAYAGAGGAEERDRLCQPGADGTGEGRLRGEPLRIDAGGDADRLRVVFGNGQSDQPCGTYAVTRCGDGAGGSGDVLLSGTIELDGHPVDLHLRISTGRRAD